MATFVIFPGLSCNCNCKGRIPLVELVKTSWKPEFPASAIWSEHTRTHPFNGPLSGTTRLSRCQKGKTNLDFTEARDSEWQWHQPGRMQVCTSLQTDNHASILPLTFYTPDALPAAQPQRQSTAGKARSCRKLVGN